ncbi:hypothetical protein ACTD5D_22135 [Nocardia takedensis]|uniref:hypothetical protein n=1 Tax=Nocardia takedensis TaxID=259390 RepID=UPI0002DD25E5|nr:hypothetical protein [Nocardia takedensis]
MLCTGTLFTHTEIDALARLAAQLWARSGDPDDILSATEKDLLNRAHALLAGEDHSDATTDDAAESVFVISHHDPIPFAINENAFEMWLAVDGNHIEALLPSSHDAQPASDLVALFEAACAADVLIEDPRLELLIDHNNVGLPGFTLMLRNFRGRHDDIALTSGYTALEFADAELSTAAEARTHLHQIINVANGLLDRITGREPTREHHDTPVPSTTKAGRP